MVSDSTRRLAPLAVALLTLLACGSPPERPNAADHVFRNARVYTLDSRLPWAQAVAVGGADITYVGDSTGLEAYVGPETEVHDVGGRLLLPGFIDSHMHPVGTAALINGLQLEPTGSIQDWLEQVEEFAADHPEHKVIFGMGHRQTTFGPDGPHRSMLDAVVPDRPVVLLSSDGHSFWENSEALRLAGITRDTSDPQPGIAYYQRDSDGQPTGYILETFDIVRALSPLADDQFGDGVEEFFGYLPYFGITTVMDAGTDESGLDRYDYLHDQARESRLPVRLELVYSMDPSDDDAVANFIAFRDRYPASDSFRVSAIKIPLDGTVEARTAAIFEDYPGEPGNRGGMSFTPEQLLRVARAAEEADVDLHVHSIGDRATHVMLDVLEQVKSERGELRGRHTLCHVELVRDDDLQRIVDLGIIIQTTPYWHRPEGFDGIPVSRPDRPEAFRFRWLIDNRVRVTFGSDFPTTIDDYGLPPLYNIEVGQTRRTQGRRDGARLGGETERLTVEQLIRGYTLDAAYQLRMEHLVGSIEVGKRADLVVLTDDIMQVPPERIHKVDVVLTMVDGRLVYESNFLTRWLFRLFF